MPAQINNRWVCYAWDMVAHECTIYDLAFQLCEGDGGVDTARLFLKIRSAMAKSTNIAGFSLDW